MPIYPLLQPWSNRIDRLAATGARIAAAQCL
jgi:hypothetical protein